MFDSEAKGLSPLQAFEAVMGFARRRGHSALQLALHAAVPQVVHVDLVQLLRLNFVRDGQRPGVVEADVLFAPFCADLGNGYFRFDDNARLQLLQQLDGGHAAPANERSLQVADFLLAYLDRERAGERGDIDPLYRSWLEIERWNALAFLDPESTAEQLAAAVQQACAPGQTRARLRVGTLAASLATPLVRHHRLLRYAAGVQALQSQSEDAPRLLATLGDEPLQVGGVALPPVAELLLAMPPPSPQEQPEAAPEPASTRPAKATKKAAPKGGAASAPALPRLRDCQYTAYVSYAHADDVAWGGWVANFHEQLERSLKARLRATLLPRMHLAGRDGPVAGNLSSELRDRLARSWSLIVVVHDHYVHSEWALRELELFKSLFGEAGLRERLHIVALSESAMRRIESSPRWQSLFPSSQVWMPFYEPSDPERPLRMFIDSGALAPEFFERMARLRDHLAERIQADQQSVEPTPIPPAASSAPAVAAPRPDDAVAHLYIESNRHETDLWEFLGDFLRARWDALCGDVFPPPRLRVRGLTLERIDEHRDLGDADGVVLLWGRKTEEALLAQINKIESRMADAAPAIVAYLMPPQKADAPVPASLWEVLRFDARDEERIHALEAELPRLDRFLQAVMKRRLARNALPRP